MPRHLEDMRTFMLLSEDAVQVRQPVRAVEETVQPVHMDYTEELLNELTDLQFRFQSFQELNEDQQYALGVEQGLNKAAEMLGRLLEKYSDLK